MLPSGLPVCRLLLAAARSGITLDLVAPDCMLPALTGIHK